MLGSSASSGAGTPRYGIWGKLRFTGEIILDPKSGIGFCNRIVPSPKVAVADGTHSQSNPNG